MPTTMEARLSDEAIDEGYAVYVLQHWEPG